jgi:uncharacterized protein with GYD domain
MLRPRPGGCCHREVPCQGELHHAGAAGLDEGRWNARKAVAEEAARSVGGTVESFHFAVGGTDAFIIADMPDAVATSVALKVSASAVVTVKAMALLDPDENAAATSVEVSYRPQARDGLGMQRHSPAWASTVEAGHNQPPVRINTGPAREAAEHTATSARRTESRGDPIRHRCLCSRPSDPKP